MASYVLTEDTVKELVHVASFQIELKMTTMMTPCRVWIRILIGEYIQGYVQCKGMSTTTSHEFSERDLLSRSTSKDNTDL